jgi:hypothetical protein
VSVLLRKPGGEKVLKITSANMNNKPIVEAETTSIIMGKLLEAMKSHADDIAAVALPEVFAHATVRRWLK